VARPAKSRCPRGSETVTVVPFPGQAEAGAVGVAAFALRHARRQECAGMPAYRDIYMEKEEPAPAPTLEELLRPEDEEALSLADFEDEQ